MVSGFWGLLSQCRGYRYPLRPNKVNVTADPEGGGREGVGGSTFKAKVVCEYTQTKVQPTRRQTMPQAFVT
jgi:hypothetical protein